MIHRQRVRVLALAGLCLFAPAAAQACACGCGVFDVGDAALMPGGAGAALWVEEDFLDQTTNWRGTGSAPAAGNSDLRLDTRFTVLGGQKMWASGWGVMVEVPFAQRTFVSDAGGPARAVTHGQLGDVKLMGVWSGFSPGRSSGLTFGLKLPTGRFDAAGFDRDTQVGTGTTDIVLGGYHMGGVGADTPWTWFAQAQWDHPLGARDGYRPGGELDAAAGLAWSASAPTAKLQWTPLVQLVASVRARDAGSAANPADTGYERLMIAPGLELGAGRWTIHGDVEIPFYQRVNGEQIVAPVMFRLSLARRF